jgi:hypothetical protein
LTSLHAVRHRAWADYAVRLKRPTDDAKSASMRLEHLFLRLRPRSFLRLDCLAGVPRREARAVVGARRPGRLRVRKPGREECLGDTREFHAQFPQMIADALRRVLREAADRTAA